MLPPDNMTCHDTGHKKKCKDICMNCWKWVQLQGNNPNTGEPMNEWKCADHWIILLTIENSQQQRQTGAATEGVRNMFDKMIQISQTPPKKKIGG